MLKESVEAGPHHCVIDHTFERIKPLLGFRELESSSAAAVADRQVGLMLGCLPEGNAANVETTKLRAGLLSMDKAP